MLYHALRHPGSGLYHGQLVATLEGPLDRTQFEEAWRLAAERHEIFRTFFAWEGRDRPLQVVRRDVDLPIEFVDWSGLESSAADARWSELLVEDRRRAFDLAAAPLMRMTVVRRGPEVHDFLWGVHHSILDGWSGELVLGEVLDDLEALRHGRPPVRPEAPSYAEFVGWLESRDSDEARRWWTRELAGVHHPTPLPVSERGEASTERHTAERQLDAATTAQVRTTASARRVTLATLTVAAWATVLARRTGDREPVFGITMSERPADIPEVHHAAGLYLDTIPVRIRMPDGAAVASWLPEVQQNLSEARARGSLGLGELKRLSEVEGPDLVRSLVVFENFPESIAHEGSSDGLRIRTIEMQGPSDLPLALLVYPGDHLSLQLVHDPAQVTDRQAQELLAEVAGLLTSFDRDASVEEMVGRPDPSAVPDAAPASVPTAWTQGPDLPGPHDDVIDRFRRQVEVHPHRVALRFESEALTYRELDRRSDALARVVAARTDAGARIGLLAPRSIDAIVAMLGVLKANRCYMPLDPDLPAARLAAMTTSAHLVLMAGGTESQRASLRCPVVALGDVARQAAEATDEPLAGGAASEAVVELVAPEDAAYVIHTSGSTGLPKGVVVERRHLAWSTAARLNYYADHPGVFLLLSAITVDSSIAGIYWTLCAGGTLCLAAHRGEQDVTALGELIRDQSVTHTLLVPSLYRALLGEVDPKHLGSLRVVVVAGEACGIDVVRAHHDTLPESALFNEYGPSEASVWATVERLSPDDEVTIGRPVPGARAWVMAADDRSAGIGEPGELVLGGAGVVRGYLDQPEETARVFGSDPVEGRSYRTGDRARWRSDGRLDFLGRIDHQIKVRGYRIEAGEVERALIEADGVTEAVVALDDDTGRPALTAWIRLDGSPTEAELRATLAETLPDYMIPARFAVVDEFPRTAAGKVDRSATTGLQAQALEDPTARDLVLPRTPVERTLAAVWREVLGVDDIGVHDDFFSLGGDSLLSIRALSRAAREGLRVDPEAFFEQPTIAHLATLLLPEQTSDDRPVTGAAPLLPIQHWYLDRITDGPEPWNQTEMLRLSTDVAPERVQKAFARLLSHHAALRLRVEQTSGGWRQVIRKPAEEIPFRIVDLSDSDDDAARIDEEANREHAATDPARGGLFRAVLFRSPAEQRLLLVAHHLVIDAVSWGFILDDLATLLATGEDAPLPARSVSILQWASALEERARQPDVKAMAEYWASSTLPDEGKQVALDMPDDGQSNRVGSGAVRTLTIDEDRTLALSVSSRRPGGRPLHHLLLAALALALARWTNRLERQFDVEGLGRDTLRGSLDPSRTVGWFTSSYPLRLRLEDADAGSALAAVAEAEAAIPLGGAAYGLLRYLHPERPVREAMRAAGGSNLLFNFLGSVDGAVSDQAPFERIEGRYGEARAASLPRAYAVEINARLERNRLVFEIEYSTALHLETSVDELTEHLDRALGELAGDVGADAPDGDAPGGGTFDLVELDAGGMSRLSDLLDSLDEA